MTEEAESILTVNSFFVVAIYGNAPKITCYNPEVSEKLLMEQYGTVGDDFIYLRKVI